MYVPSPTPTQPGIIGRIVKWELGCLLLGIALLLPYKARIDLSELLGRVTNAIYTGYIRMLTWLLRKVQEPSR